MKWTKHKSNQLCFQLQISPEYSFLPSPNTCHMPSTEKCVWDLTFFRHPNTMKWLVTHALFREFRDQRFIWWTCWNSSSVCKIQNPEMKHFQYNHCCIVHLAQNNMILIIWWQKKTHTGNPYLVQATSVFRSVSVTETVNNHLQIDSLQEEDIKSVTVS